MVLVALWKNIWKFRRDKISNAVDDRYFLFISFPPSTPHRALEMTSVWEGQGPLLAMETPWTPPFPKKCLTLSQVAPCDGHTLNLSVYCRNVLIMSSPLHQPSPPWRLLRVTRLTLEVLWSVWTPTRATATGTVRRWMGVRRWETERKKEILNKINKFKKVIFRQSHTPCDLWQKRSKQVIFMKLKIFCMHQPCTSNGENSNKTVLDTCIYSNI